MLLRWLLLCHLVQILLLHCHEPAIGYSNTCRDCCRRVPCWRRFSWPLLLTVKLMPLPSPVSSYHVQGGVLLRLLQLLRRRWLLLHLLLGLQLLLRLLLRDILLPLRELLRAPCRIPFVSCAPSA